MASETPNMPAPETTDPKFWEPLWEWLFLPAGGGLLLAIKRTLRKKSDESEPAWVGRIIEALERVNDATTENIRSVLTLYGKDVSEIRSAQERVADDLGELKRAVGDLRIEVAKVRPR